MRKKHEKNTTLTWWSSDSCVFRLGRTLTNLNIPVATKSFSTGNLKFTNIFEPHPLRYKKLPTVLRDPTCARLDNADRLGRISTSCSSDSLGCYWGVVVPPSAIRLSWGISQVVGTLARDSCVPFSNLQPPNHVTMSSAQSTVTSNISHDNQQRQFR